MRRFPYWPPRTPSLASARCPAYLHWTGPSAGAHGGPAVAQLARRTYSAGKAIASRKEGREAIEALAMMER